MKYLPTKSLTGGALIGVTASSVLLIILWHVATPLQSGPLGILAVFTLIYVFCTALFLVATGILSLARNRLAGRPAIPDRRRYYVSSVLGLLPVLYLTLLSMGGASVWGVGLIVVFIVLMLFYVLRRSA